LCVKLAHVNVGAVGAAVSKIIVQVTLLDVFPKLSLHLINTVFVPSVVANVCAIEELQLVQLVGLIVLPKATCTPHAHASVAQVVFKVTAVLFVAAAPLFIVNAHQVGAVVSNVIVHDVIADSLQSFCHCA